MANLRCYSSRDIHPFLSPRAGETKLGERIQFVPSLKELKNSSARFVLLGIPEDIGIRANYGNAGASKAWNSFLAAFLNIQHNHFIVPKELILLGEINCTVEMEKASNLDLSDPNYMAKMGEWVEAIDQAVSETIKAIVMAGKIPILIGGGHNNAYGNLKGSSEAINQKMNVLNIDAHSDFRLLEHRHSGNGFSYAKKKGFLEKYAIFGLHENYTPEYIFEQIQDSEEIKIFLFEELFSSNKETHFKKALKFVASHKFGLELDCDAMAYFPSSAMAPSGFSFQEVRKMVQIVATEKNCTYFHLCEAIPRENYPTGKALSYLVSDFVKINACIKDK